MGYEHDVYDEPRKVGFHAIVVVLVVFFLLGVAAYGFWISQGSAIGISFAVVAMVAVVGAGIYFLGATTVSYTAYLWNNIMLLAAETRRRISMAKNMARLDTAKTDCEVSAAEARKKVGEALATKEKAYIEGLPPNDQIFRQLLGMRVMQMFPEFQKMMEMQMKALQQAQEGEEAEEVKEEEPSGGGRWYHRRR